MSVSAADGVALSALAIVMVPSAVRGFLHQSSFLGPACGHLDRYAACGAGERRPPVPRGADAK